MISNRRLFAVAWPYTLSMATSFIIQAVDSSMVAPLGATALAALTVAGTSAFFPGAVSMGLITAVQKGTAGDGGRSANRALSAGLLVALMVALPFVAFYFLAAEWVAALYTNGPTAALASTYIRLFSPAFVLLALNHAVHGFWIGILKTRTRLFVTIFMTAVNVGANLLLIPRYRLPGVAIGSTLALASAFILNLGLAIRFEGYRWVSPDAREVLDVLRTTSGVSANQVALGLTLNVAVVLVGLIGRDALAIANVVGVLATPILYLGIGYGTATGSFLIRAFADRDPAAAQEVSSQALRQVAAFSLGLAIILILAAPTLRTWFFVDPATSGLARTPFRLLALLYLVDGLCCTLQRFHFVADRLRQSFVIMTTVPWLLSFPIAYFGISRLHWGYSTYLGLHVASRALVTGLLYRSWRTRLGESPGPRGPIV